MNVSLNTINAATGLIKVEIEKNDYAEPLNKSLRKLRQKVNMPGFRQGMVPLELVKKIYGKQAMAEEINKLVSESLYAYIRDNQVKILGEPLPNETEQKMIDFDADEHFEFLFDIALSPEIDVHFSKDDSVTAYRMIIDNEFIDKQVDYYRKEYGTFDLVESVEAEDLVKGTLTELEDGTPKAGGIVVEDAPLMPSYMKGKLEQKKFLKAKKGDTVVFNPYKAYKGAEAELASFLKIDKSAVKEMKSDFLFEIKEISRYTPAELNQAFFDQIFGKDTVKSESEFRDMLKQFLTNRHQSEMENKIKLDIHDLLLKKVGDVAFADDILKRWLLISNEKTTKEAVEKDYSQLVEDLKYRLVKDKFVKALDIKAEKEDIETLATRIVRSQFAQYYGSTTPVPDETVEGYVRDMLKKQETVDNLIERITDEKLSVYLKDQITIVEKEVTMDEYRKIQGEKGDFN